MATRSTTRDVPAQLARTRRRFERWRQARRGRSPIPKPLWDSAVKAAGKYGVHRTAQALGLDYYSLKKHVGAAASPSKSDRQAAATFVELTSPVSGGGPECILELEDPGGAKMRVHLKGVEAPDVVALSRSFWRVEP